MARARRSRISRRKRAAGGARGHDLRLAAAHRAALREQALAAYPKECCGLLSAAPRRRPCTGRGQGRTRTRRRRRHGAAVLTVTQVLPSVNRDPAGGARAFEVDPELILTWHKRLRGTQSASSAITIPIRTSRRGPRPSISNAPGSRA